MKFILVILINVSFVFCDSVTEKMKEFGIVPNIIDVSPQKIIKVSFPLLICMTYLKYIVTIILENQNVYYVVFDIDLVS